VRIRRSCCAALLSLACALPLGAQVQPDALPEDDRERWTVGFAELEPVELDLKLRYLAYSIPLVLREKLLAVREHEIGEEEAAAYRAILVENEVRRLSGLLGAARRARELAVAGGGEADPSALREIEKKKQQVDLLTDRIRGLGELDPAKIRLVNPKPVGFWSGRSGSDASSAPGLLPSPRYSPLATLRDNSLDLLVFGSIEQVQDYLFLSVKAIDYARARLLLDYQDAFLATSVGEAVDAVATELAGVLLGRSWAALRVTAEPQEAEIRIDGEFAGIGSASLPFARLGDHQLRVAARGYATSERTVSLEANGGASVEVSLQPVEPVIVTLSSSPLLADVYVDSVWQGRTPLELPRPVGLSRVQLLRDGYETESLHLSDASPALTDITLPPFTIDPALRQRRARNAFYGALGAWVVSLPLPIFLWAYSLDQVAPYQSALGMGDVATAVEFRVKYRRLYAGYLGGLFVNVSLLANVVINLVRYIESADRPAG